MQGLYGAAWIGKKTAGNAAKAAWAKGNNYYDNTKKGFKKAMKGVMQNRKNGKFRPKDLAKVDKYQNKLNNADLKSKKYIDKGFKMSKLNRGFKIAGRVVGVLSFAMSAVSVGMGIYNIIKMQKNSEKIGQLQDEYEEAFEKYRSLNDELFKNVFLVKSVGMTVDSRNEALAVVDVIVDKVGYAILEATALRDSWLEVEKHVRQMGQDARLAQDYTRENQKVAFDDLADYLVDMRTTWNEVYSNADKIKKKERENEYCVPLMRQLQLKRNVVHQHLLTNLNL